MNKGETNVSDGDKSNKLTLRDHKSFLKAVILHFLYGG